MGEYEEFFKFAAKAGALEGYLFERERVEPLSNWVSNIEDMYKKLSASIKEDIKKEYGIVLEKTLNNGQKVLEDEMKLKLHRILSELKE